MYLIHSLINEMVVDTRVVSSYADARRWSRERRADPIVKGGDIVFMGTVDVNIYDIRLDSSDVVDYPLR